MGESIRVVNIEEVDSFLPTLYNHEQWLLDGYLLRVVRESADSLKLCPVICSSATDSCYWVDVSNEVVSSVSCGSISSSDLDILGARIVVSSREIANCGSSSPVSFHVDETMPDIAFRTS